MLEKALVGTRRYYGLLAILAGTFALGFFIYLKDFHLGMGSTGMGRDVSWGLHISQYTYLVGVAASAVMVVLPYYLHNYKAFGRVAILGEFLAVAAITMCITFVMMDLGRPDRVFNLFKYPTPGSIMFWNIIVLPGYLTLNILIGWKVLECERFSVAPPKWIKFLIYVSIPWGIGIHTVTSFLFAGLAGRGYWNSAIMTPRFLSSAFCSGPALLILLALLVRKYTKFDPGKEQIQSLGKIVTYATLLNVFFFFCEVFVVFYGQIPEHMVHFEYLFIGLDGKGQMVPLMWFAIVGMVITALLLTIPGLRKNETTLAALCGMVMITTWIDKGLGLMTGGFVPNPLGQVTEYWPTMPEAIITLGVWALGFLVLTILYKVAVSIKEEIRS